jgi:hypothetical protein
MAIKTRPESIVRPLDTLQVLAQLDQLVGVVHDVISLPLQQPVHLFPHLTQQQLQRIGRLTAGPVNRLRLGLGVDVDVDVNVD